MKKKRAAVVESITLFLSLFWVSDGAAAKKYRWHFVDGIQSAFRKHGYCAGKAQWMVTLNDSWKVRQGNPYGVMHPNQAGHRAYARAILTKMNQVLKLDVPIPK